MIALIDYKAGNLTSVRKALAAVQAEVFTPERPGDLGRAAGIIVPGVGHFASTQALDTPWVEAVLASIGEGKPLLGICLGMQWLFEGSDESPDLPGLGLLSGRCFRLSGAVAGSKGPGLHGGAGRLKIPHVGWNTLTFCRTDAIVDGVADGSQVYFTHSFVAPVGGDTVATTEHGETFASVVQRGQVTGVQFHPEKSGDVGLRVLRNFLEMTGH